MKGCLLALLLLVCAAVPAQAQSAIIITPTSVIAWDVQMPSVAAAQGQTYALLVDAVAPMILTGVTCAAGTAPLQTCTVPAIGRAPVTGSHTLRVTASDGVSTSLPSNTFSYFIITLMVPPTGLRVQP